MKMIFLHSKCKKKILEKEKNIFIWLFIYLLRIKNYLKEIKWLKIANGLGKI